MASSKESMMVIMDVGFGAESLTQKASECCINLLKHKILQSKKDEIGFLLFRTLITDNALNNEIEGYSHISEFIQCGIPDWMTVAKFAEYRDKSKSKSGDWLGALIVAMSILKKEKEDKKIGSLKIVMFFDFNAAVDEKNHVKKIIQGLKSLNINLILISSNVQYEEDADGNVKSIFSDYDNKSDEQLKSESIALKLIEGCDGHLYNFDMALKQMLHVENMRPWTWNSVLEIGSLVTINICATIAVKDDAKLKYTTECIREGETCWNATEYFNDGKKFEPAPSDLLSGYMVGGTPIPFDEKLGMEMSSNTVKGMKCMMFTKSSLVAPEYLCGDGYYLVLARKDMEASEKMMFALVKAMSDTDSVMIARRVYNNGNKPKMMALFPNMEREVPCLSMFELFYSDQYLAWNFPPLTTNRTKPSKEQYEAIENLIESMDLSGSDKGNIRDTYDKKLISLENLPNLTVENMLNAVTAKVLRGSQVEVTRNSTDVESFVNITDEAKEEILKALEEVKNQFPLEKTKKTNKKELIQYLGDIPTQSVNEFPPEQTSDVSEVITDVGTITPAEDFADLLERLVFKESNEDVSQANFARISNQIRTVISDLLFKTLTLQTEKIVEALKTYREQACFFNPWDYNDWIKEIKKRIISRKMFDFWEIIVREELGLCSAKDCDFFHDMEDKEPEEFYKLSNIDKNNDSNQQEEQTVDDLFENM